MNPPIMLRSFRPFLAAALVASSIGAGLGSAIYGQLRLALDALGTAAPASLHLAVTLTLALAVFAVLCALGAGGALLVASARQRDRATAPAVETMPGGPWVTTESAASPRPDETPDRPDASVDERGAEPVTPLRLLVADPDRAARCTLGATLDRLGHHTHLVADGDAAVRAVQQQRFDAVLVAFEMPQVDGLDVTRRIRADSFVVQPHIVAMAPEVTHAERAACVAAGMDGVFATPIDRATLAEWLARLAAEQPLHADAVPTLPSAFNDAPEQRTAFLLDVRERLRIATSALKAALQADDLPTAARHARSLRAVAEMIGASALRDHTTAVRAAADAGDLSATVHAYLPLHAEAKSLDGRLEAALLPAEPEAALAPL